MAELIGIPSTVRTPARSDRWARVAWVAARQHGVISRAQLTGCGVSGAVISRWTAEGRLHRLYPAVYVVGHPAIGIRGRLFAATLYAGAGAALSRQTAAWWWRLVSSRPRHIHVSTIRDRRSVADLSVHRPRAIEHIRRGGLLVTPVSRTLLDLAATLPFDQLRKAVAEADHRNRLDPGEIAAQLGRGRRGSAALRRALSVHLPELADAASELERRFLLLCERARIPIPEVNVFIEGMKVDCVWRAQRVVVELDGHQAHDRAAAAERDRHRDLTLRAAGFVVLRYTWQQVVREPDAVVADLVAALCRPPGATS